jgi:hypothetical protein
MYVIREQRLLDSTAQAALAGLRVTVASTDTA